jgi:hypothetical protein
MIAYLSAQSSAWLAPGRASRRALRGRRSRLQRPPRRARPHPRQRGLARATTTVLRVPTWVRERLAIDVYEVDDTGTVQPRPSGCCGQQEADQLGWRR